MGPMACPYGFLSVANSSLIIAVGTYSSNNRRPFLIGVTRWLSGRASDLRSKGRGVRGPAVTLLRNNLRQVVHTPLPHLRDTPRGGLWITYQKKKIKSAAVLQFCDSTLCNLITVTVDFMTSRCSQCLAPALLKISWSLNIFSLIGRRTDTHTDRRTQCATQGPSRRGHIIRINSIYQSTSSNMVSIMARSSRL